MCKLLVLTLCAGLASGCATAGTSRIQPSADPIDPVLLASYVSQLPIGSRVRVDLVDGHTLRGTLMQTTDTTIVVQRATRIPEPPQSLLLSNVAAVRFDPNTGSPGRAIVIGAVAGAGGALAVFLILAAIFAGD